MEASAKLNFNHFQPLGFNDLLFQKIIKYLLYYIFSGVEDHFNIKGEFNSSLDSVSALQVPITQWYYMLHCYPLTWISMIEFM